MVTINNRSDISVGLSRQTCGHAPQQTLSSIKDKITLFAEIFKYRRNSYDKQAPLY